MKPLGELLGAAAMSVVRVIRERVPMWHPHDVGFDPNNPKHVPALRLYPEAQHLGGSRYRIGSGLVVDRLGSFRDPNECPECGTVPGVSDFRYFVRQLPPPGAKPWEISFRPCSRCVSPQEIAENEAFMNGTRPSR